MLLDNFSPMMGRCHRIGSVASIAGKISMGARREVVSAVTERYRSAKRAEKGRILDELCATTDWHRKHAVRALRRRETVGPGEVEATRKRRRRYGATIKDALTALREASDRVCGKRLKVMIPSASRLTSAPSIPAGSATRTTRG
ncbi:hypothetical protein QA649_04640 [Bradyrhizobium sp. CB1717]|uniref:hypothetical protein n=1 Tax=Bradyrhizobium sp. CB1717 TaxID=3039154 RepID=UPI0024B16146|nr:hypothetical protein [Bradyrhizobium sp. CB1717]WFU29125.1 hypothetical protein QA649_04640 [Bradyrhizobium sp. CB1717]